jgi:ABC-2 type transport system permease protein
VNTRPTMNTGPRTMSGAVVRAVLTAEWTKIRTLRSTVVTLALALVVSAGLAYLVGRSFRGQAAAAPGTHDPLFATFYTLTLGQLPLVVFGVLTVSGEYASGTIRASLAAVPRRGLFYGGKVLAGGLVTGAAAAATVLATFIAAQAGLGPRHVTLGGPGVTQATVGAWLYLTLICLFAMGLAATLRSSAFSLTILLPLLFLGSQGLGNIPKAKNVLQYLPEEAGLVIMHIAGQPGDPRFGRAYGPWTGVGILALWAAAALIAGYLLLRRRDA